LQRGEYDSVGRKVKRWELMDRKPHCIQRPCVQKVREGGEYARKRSEEVAGTVTKTTPSAQEVQGGGTEGRSETSAPSFKRVPDPKSNKGDTLSRGKFGESGS